MNHTPINWNKLISHYIEEETKDKMVSFVLGVLITLIIYFLL